MLKERRRRRRKWNDEERPLNIKCFWITLYNHPTFGGLIDENVQLKGIWPQGLLAIAYVNVKEWEREKRWERNEREIVDAAAGNPFDHLRGKVNN